MEDGEIFHGLLWISATLTNVLVVQRRQCQSWRKLRRYFDCSSFTTNLLDLHQCTVLQKGLKKRYYCTLEGIASICFRFYFQQTLRIQIQGCQGCQKTRNFKRNSKILIARSTIQPELSKIKNNLPFFMEFWCISQWFLILFNFGWMVDLAMSIFEFLTKFLVFWHPWHP